MHLKHSIWVFLCKVIAKVKIFILCREIKLQKRKIYIKAYTLD